MSLNVTVLETLASAETRDVNKLLRKDQVLCIDKEYASVGTREGKMLFASRLKHFQCGPASSLKQSYSLHTGGDIL